MPLDRSSLLPFTDPMGTPLNQKPESHVGMKHAIILAHGIKLRDKTYDERW